LLLARSGASWPERVRKVVFPIQKHKKARQVCWRVFGSTMSLWLNDEMDGEKQGSTFFGGASTVFRVRKITKIAVPGSVEVLASSAGVALAHDDRIGRAHCNSR